MTASETWRRVRDAAWLIPVVVLSGFALVVVLRCGYRFPYSDDWDLVVPILSGQRTIDLSWLWAQHNEHRIPISKIVLITSDALIGGDFRGGVFVNWLILVAVSIHLYRCAITLTGSHRFWTGLLFAAIVLNPSNNALRWGVENQFVVSAGLMVAAMCASISEPSKLRISVAGLSSVLLPMTGGNGVLFSIAAIAATVYSALRSRRFDERCIAAVSTLLTLVLIAFYFKGYHRPHNHDMLATHSIRDAIVVFLHVLVAPFGPHVSRLLVFSAPVAILTIVAAAVMLLRAYRRGEVNSSLVVSFGLAVGGSCLVFGGIAFGRGARGWPPGLEAHYASLGIPFWGMVGLVLLAVRARILVTAICVSATAAFFLATPFGPRPPYVAMGDAFQRDWCNGISSSVLANRHIQLLYYVDTVEARAILSVELEAIRRKPFAAWRCAP